MPSVEFQTNFNPIMITECHQIASPERFYDSLPCRLCLVNVVYWIMPFEYTSYIES